MTITISSQRFLDPETIDEKLEGDNFEVTLSPAFDVDGETYQVVLDGHHRLAAATLLGIDPEYVVDSGSCVCALLDEGLVEDFLESTYIDAPYYNIYTLKAVWE